MRNTCLSLLLILLGGLPGAAALAQQDAEPPPADEAVTSEAGTGQAQPEADEPEDAPPERDDDSPFDYQASEQISEDLSVSFPVDI